MLKDKELKDRIIEDHEGSSANSDMTLDRLRGRIEKIAAANSVPVDLAIDELRIGNALSNTTGDVLVLRNPEHRDDYFGLCIMFKSGGVRPVVNAYFCGNSKQLGLEMKQRQAKANRYNRVTKSLERGTKTGTSIFGTMQAFMITIPMNLASAVMSLVRAIQRNDEAIAKEETYYNNCVSIIKMAVDE